MTVFHLTEGFALNGPVAEALEGIVESSPIYDAITVDDYADTLQGLAVYVVAIDEWAADLLTEHYLLETAPNYAVVPLGLNGHSDFTWDIYLTQAYQTAAILADVLAAD